MRRLITLPVWITFLVAAAGCAAVRGSSVSPKAAAPGAQATSTDRGTASGPSPSPTSTPASPLLESCNLLDSRDLASLYSSAEVMLPTPHVDQVDHVIFSTDSVSALENSCVYYVFHLPGSKDGEMLQVEYWVDVPEHTTSGAWAGIWSSALSKAGEQIPAVGGGAFFEDGRLTFKQGDSYVTIGVTGTRLNTATGVGVAQQLRIEEQLAEDAVAHF